MYFTIPTKKTGQAIVDDFLKAAKFQESPDVKWDAIEFVGDFKTGEGAAEQVPLTKGAFAFPCHRKKKYWIFGPDRWVRDWDCELYLEPLNLEEEYDEVRVVSRLAPPPRRQVITDADCVERRKKQDYLFHRANTIILNAFF